MSDNSTTTGDSGVTINDGTRTVITALDAFFSGALAIGTRVGTIGIAGFATINAVDISLLAGHFR